MNKNEILETSRRENAHGDERQKYIDLKAYENGNFWMLIILVALMLISFFVLIITGRELIDIQTLSLGMFLSLAGESFTRYHLKKSHCILSVLVLAIIAVITTIGALIAEFLGM